MLLLIIWPKKKESNGDDFIRHISMVVISPDLYGSVPDVCECELSFFILMLFLFIGSQRRRTLTKQCFVKGEVFMVGNKHYLMH